MPAQSSSAARRKPSTPPPHIAPPARVRLSQRHERAVYAAVAALLVTGCGWLVCHYLLAESGEFGTLPHPFESLWLELHGAAGMIALVLFGSLLSSHMPRAWSLRRGRWSGGVLASLFVLLAITGYGLYYAGGESLRAWTSVIHWGVGLGLPVLLVAHVKTLRTRLRRILPD
jgi:uncharacterized membrane protein YhdT